MKTITKTISFLMIIITIGLYSQPLAVYGATQSEKKTIRGFSTPSGIEYVNLEEEITQYIDERKSGTASVSLAVFQNQVTLYETYYGYANIDAGVKVTEETVYEWGSITKMLVWVSVMQLYEQGMIDLDVDIRKYIPDSFLTKLSYDTPITMTHLMNHTAGWQETTYDIEVSHKEDIVSLEQALKASEPAQIYEPGTVCAYSNWGTALAAFIVECITGEDFYNYVHHNVFEPLNMYKTSLAPDCSDNEWVKEQRQLLNCYSIYDDSYEDFGQCINYILLYPAGSATGTLNDLVLFAKAFVPEEGQQSPLFQNRDTLEIMLSATSYYKDSEISRNSHGLWTLQYSVNVLGHNGNTEGCTSTLMFDKDSGIGIVVMTNEVGETAYNYGLLSLVFGEYEADAQITESPNLSGIYTSTRSYEKGFTKLYKYIGSIMPLSKTKDATVHKLSIGQGTLTQVANGQYIMDNGNGNQFFMYLNKNADGKITFQMMSQDIVKENTGSFTLKIISLALIFVSILYAFTAIIRDIVHTILRICLKKENKEVGNSIWKIGRLIVLVSIIIVGWMIYYLILMPLDGGSVLKTQVIWKCVVIGILSLIPVVNLCIIVKNSKRFEGTKRQKVRYIVTAIFGLIITFHIWYWQLFNFWSC